jgi:hypothetical protein
MCDHDHQNEPTCEGCAHFLNDPARLEAQLPGIGALSSAYGSCRGRAGICAVDQTFRDPVAACTDFRRRPGADR